MVQLIASALVPDGDGSGSGGGGGRRTDQLLRCSLPLHIISLALMASASPEDIRRRVRRCLDRPGGLGESATAASYLARLADEAGESELEKVRLNAV